MHLFDFSDDLYDQEIEIRFVSHLRGEIKFPSMDSLRIQIQQDVINAKQILTDFSCTEIQNLDIDFVHANTLLMNTIFARVAKFLKEIELVIAHRILRQPARRRRFEVQLEFSWGSKR